MVNFRGGYQPHTIDEKKLVVAEMKKLFHELVAQIQAIVVFAA